MDSASNTGTGNVDDSIEGALGEVENRIVFLFCCTFTLTQWLCVVHQSCTNNQTHHWNSQIHSNAMRLLEIRDDKFDLRILYG